MNNKQYPLHHDHGTVTISRDVFKSMTAELERLRPMEASLELAEANRDAYKKRVEELTAEHHKERHEYIDWVNRLQKENAEFKDVYKDSVDVKVKIWERCKKAEDELRHHKYKRSLAMSRIALDDWHLHNSFYAMGHQEFEKRKCEFYEKWRQRWLAIAEKFKETNK